MHFTSRLLASLALLGTVYAAPHAEPARKFRSHKHAGGDSRVSCYTAQHTAPVPQRYTQWSTVTTSCQSTSTATASTIVTPDATTTDETMTETVSIGADE